MTSDNRWPLNNGDVAEADWRECWIKVQGHLVFVRMGPEVPGSIPLVHVHGFAVSGTYLLPTARVLARRATTAVPDLPGYGRSTAWGHALGIPSLAWALLDVLDALAFERVFLIGNSMGGLVSLKVAHSAPERVAGTVLASPAGGIHNQPFGRALLQLARDVRRENLRMIPVVLPDYLHFGLLNGLHLFSELVRFPSLERLLRTPVPMLAVFGSRDPTITRDVLRDYAGRAHAAGDNAFSYGILYARQQAAADAVLDRLPAARRESRRRPLRRWLR